MISVDEINYRKIGLWTLGIGLVIGAVAIIGTKFFAKQFPSTALYGCIGGGAFFAFVSILAAIKIRNLQKTREENNISNAMDAFNNNKPLFVISCIINGNTVLEFFTDNTEAEIQHSIRHKDRLPSNFQVCTDISEVIHKMNAYFPKALKGKPKEREAFLKAIKANQMRGQSCFHKKIGRIGLRLVKEAIEREPAA